MTGMMPEGAGERAVSTGWKLVILDVVNWSVFLSGAGLFYRNARKGESRIEAMREALAARDEESFYEGVREVVSPHPLRPRMVWAMAPMFVMMALLPAIYAKLAAVTRREADMLLAVDKRFGELVARKPEKKDLPESL